jgi:hyperosmotically inducible periplasmic protein
VLLSTIACNSPARTSNSSADSTEQAANQSTDKNATQGSQNDATSETRRRQLNADNRAREERNNTVNDGKAENRADADLRSQVRNKLEANLPASQLTIDASEGTVKVSGTVVDQKQVEKIEPLAREIKGVKNVEVAVNVASAAKPDAPNSDTKTPIKDQTNSR